MIAIFFVLSSERFMHSSMMALCKQYGLRAELVRPRGGAVAVVAILHSYRKKFWQTVRKCMGWAGSGTRTYCRLWYENILIPFPEVVQLPGILD
jgi:hypothetical protein